MDPEKTCQVFIPDFDQQHQCNNNRTHRNNSNEVRMYLMTETAAAAVEIGECEGNGDGVFLFHNENDISRYSSISATAMGSNHRNRCSHSSHKKPKAKFQFYGIGLVCLGGALNWFGFAQCASIISDPLKYIGLLCVIVGCICVLFALCNWLGKPFLTSSASYGLTRYQEDYLNSRLNCDIQIINVPTCISPKKTKDYLQPESQNPPPKYEQIILEDEKPPPSYIDAIKRLLLLPQAQEDTNYYNVAAAAAASAVDSNNSSSSIIIHEPSKTPTQAKTSLNLSDSEQINERAGIASSALLINPLIKA